MGSRSSYFFEPMKDNGSLNPIMPRENYVELNNMFGEYFAAALDSIGSFYFTKEVFDGTYPGYGSSYPDLQGGLGLLFEQASSRGHKQKTEYGEITFPFTIRNQYTSSITTVKAAVENKAYLRKYQQDFFKSALRRADRSRVKAYSFGDDHDKNRVKAFIDKLLLHKIKVYKGNNNQFVVPTSQPQYRMVQTMFETYDRYRDSVYYDASAWSVANFYNMKYRNLIQFRLGEEVTSTDDLTQNPAVTKASYAYIIDGDDYNAITTLNFLQENGIVVAGAFKPFTARTTTGNKTFQQGSLVVPISLQKKDADAVFELVSKAQMKYQAPVYGVETGYNASGIDLGSRYVESLTKPKAAMLIGQGTRSYEAGEVWHLLDTRVHMPITKIPLRNFNRAALDKYNTLVMVSGNYSLTEKQQEKVKNWVSQGNTLITIGTASKWIVEKKWVKEKLIEKEEDSTKAVKRLPFIDASEHSGRERLGGVILKGELDNTHPLGFGYRDNSIPVYKNNTVYLAPSRNKYSTVIKYARNPHIDGFISPKNMEENIKPSASLLVSKLGSGRVILFADNPNFRGSWYGTNRLFLNALFLGDKIYVPN